MDFEEPREYGMIRSTAEEIADEYGPEYWREKEEAGEYAHDFWDGLADAGFHGLLVPDDYGGAGMGMQEMGVAMETLCAEGCGMAGTWYLVLTGCMATAGIKAVGDDDQ
ncbi:MAG: acyl-CoA dehydrogenase family protein, partial [Halobacteria archaeon]|nr:acyl-CoA dehydrogenase family protein [Halobacteria archaeon]